MEICSQQIPINLEAAPGHWVACHLYGEGRPVPIPIDKKVDVSTNGTDSDAAVTEAAAT
jgi:hypothetical protein